MVSRFGKVLPAALAPVLCLLAHTACGAGPVGAFPPGSLSGKPAPAPAPYVPGRPDDAPPAPTPDAAPDEAPAPLIPPAFPAQAPGSTAATGDNAGSGRVHELMAESADPSARARALETLPLSENAEHGISRCVAGLGDPSPEVREAAAKCVTDTPPAHLFAYVMRTMAWGTPEKVRALDAALPRLAGPMDALLLETLNTELETPRHRRAAAYCLGRMGVVPAAQSLARHAWAPDPDLAGTCARALGMLRWPGAYNDLVALMEHPDMAARMASMRALAEMNTPPGWRAVADTAAGKTGQGARVRAEAVRLLGMLPVVEAIPALLDVMRADKSMAQPAARVLKEITGLNYGPDPEAWARELLLEPLPPRPPDPGGTSWEETEAEGSANSETSTPPSSGAKTPKGRRK